MVLVLSNDDVAQILDMKDCVSALEDGFTELGRGNAVASNRRDNFSPTKDDGVFYRFNTMEGIVHKIGVCAQRVDSERITWKNVGGVMRQVELPSSDGSFVGLVYLYSINECKLLAIITDSQIQRMRVAGVCAVAAKYLARKDSKIMGLYGSGWQAEAQVLAMKAVRDITSVRVYSPTASHRVRFAETMSKTAGVDVKPLDNASEVPRGSDIVSTATNARETVCNGAWVSPGQYLTGIGGADYDQKAWERADLVYMCAKALHEKNMMENPEFRPDLSHDHMFGSGGVDKSLYERFGHKIHYLPHLLVGKSPTRSSDSQITLFQKAGTTQGVEFATTSKVAYDLARKQGLGKELPDEWFTQRTPQ